MSTRLADLTQFRKFQQPMFEKAVDGYTVTLLDVADRLCKMKFRGWSTWEYTGISFVATSRVEGSYVGGSLTITLQDGCAAIGIDVPKRRMKVTYKRFGSPPPMVIDCAINEAMYSNGKPLTATVPTDGKPETLGSEPSVGGKLKDGKTVMIAPEFPVPCKSCSAMIYRTADGMCALCRSELPVTMERAVAVLNERKYRGVSRWRISAGMYSRPYVFWADDGAVAPLHNRLTEFEAIAIAEALMKSSDTAP